MQFELSKVETRVVRRRMLGHLEKINGVLASQVGAALGETAALAPPGGTADSAGETHVLAGAASPTSASGGAQQSPALSMEGQPASPRGRKVAILATSGFGALSGQGGSAVQATKTFANTSSVLYDAVFAPGGAPSAQKLRQMGDARTFVAEAYKHAKAIAGVGEGVGLLEAALPAGALPSSDGRTANHLGSSLSQAAPGWINPSKSSFPPSDADAGAANPLIKCRYETA